MFLFIATHLKRKKEEEVGFHQFRHAVNLLGLTNKCVFTIKWLFMSCHILSAAQFSICSAGLILAAHYQHCRAIRPSGRNKELGNSALYMHSDRQGPDQCLWQSQSADSATLQLSRFILGQTRLTKSKWWKEKLHLFRLLGKKPQRPQEPHSKKIVGVDLPPNRSSETSPGTRMIRPVFIPLLGKFSMFIIITTILDPF